MRISDWSSDVCSSDLRHVRQVGADRRDAGRPARSLHLAGALYARILAPLKKRSAGWLRRSQLARRACRVSRTTQDDRIDHVICQQPTATPHVRLHQSQPHAAAQIPEAIRTEENTSELQSLIRISDALCSLKKKIHYNNY